jgi:hypothetical protein
MSLPSLPRFQCGQTVRLTQSKRVARPTGSFEIGRLLPEQDGVKQYLIRSTTDGHQRVVAEYEIA